MKIKFQISLIVALFVTIIMIFSYKSKITTRVKDSEVHQVEETDNLPPFFFDDIWNSSFSYSTFYPNWVSPTEYITRTADGIVKINLENSNTVTIVSSEFYEKIRGDGWGISNDEEYLLIRSNWKKQWRHSYNASYSIYRIADETLMVDVGNGSSDVQYVTWSPTNHGIVWVEENNLYYMEDVADPSSIITLENNGGKNTIFNGVPDWVYEEEMVSSTNNIYWSPDSDFIAYLVTDDTLVEKIEFSKFENHQYPEMVEVGYPKAGTMNPKVTLKVYNVTGNETIIVQAPTELIGEDHLFCSFYWYADSKAFLVNWLNRISNKAAPQLCTVDHSSEWDCEVIEDGVEESATGWIGNGGTPFRPVMLNNGTRSYYTAFSNSEGYWQIAFVNSETDEKTFLTEGTSVVTSVQGVNKANNYLYFIAAHPTPRVRHLYRIPTNQDASSYPISPADWTCLTCDLDEQRCQWISPSFGPTLRYLVVNCGGPDVPKSTLQELGADGEYGEAEVVVNNDMLISNKAGKKWPTKEYGEIEKSDGFKILYQIHKPMDFSMEKKYPLLIEVYGGPGFQKVQDRWTRSWAPIHMVSQYDIVVVSLDGRGSGYRGDDIAHLLYKRIGQLEKEDTTEVGRHFAAMPWIDETKIAVWGWSYGGYTTTFTISEGSGVFKCGFAVAPLATRFLYDTIHTERYMTLPKDNPEGYERCSILNANLQNFKNASYSIIHGMADDNVHFQNAALISKALINAGVDFDNFFYADEAHSINTGENARRHIYRLLTRKTCQCFDLEFYEENQGYSAVKPHRRYFRKNQYRAKRSLQLGDESEILKNTNVQF